MSVGRLLIVSGVLLIAVGIAVTLLSKASIPLGRLPGDIVWKGKNTTFYFPVVTCLLVSIIASLLFWLLSRR
jgi:ribose/xylose/arabinose/galactoside ABC-type transport system permease subunit